MTTTASITTTAINTHAAAVADLERLKSALARAQAASTVADVAEAELSQLGIQRAQVVAAAFVDDTKADTLAIDAKMRTLEKSSADNRADAAAAAQAIPVLAAQILTAQEAVTRAHHDALHAAIADAKAEFDSLCQAYAATLGPVRDAISVMLGSANVIAQLQELARLPDSQVNAQINKAAWCANTFKAVQIDGLGNWSAIGVTIPRSTHAAERLAELRAMGLPMSQLPETSTKPQPVAEPRGVTVLQADDAGVMRPVPESLAPRSW